MEEVLGEVQSAPFKIETVLNKQKDVGNVLFANMDKTTSEKCKFYKFGQCERGEFCPFRHIKDFKTIVCKHWLRGLCKKGDACDFLHEYSLDKMPECHFFTNFKECSNEMECLFLHIDPNSRIKECQWYQRGLCKNGPTCRNKHTRKAVCNNFIAGFCPLGQQNCKYGHPTYGFTLNEEYLYFNNNNSSNSNITKLPLPTLPMLPPQAPSAIYTKLGSANNFQ